MPNLRGIIFDLDNTLAEAFHPPEPSMLERLARVIEKLPTAIMSAASFARLEKDVLPNFPANVDFSRLTLFCANAAHCFRLESGGWHAVYKFGFTPEEHDIIKRALFESVAEAGLDTSAQKYGEQFVDYDGYIAYTALGLGAPSAERKAWDPDASKRLRLRTILQQKLPQFDVYIGGATSVDVTPKGINKAYGVEQYAKQLNCTPSELLYIGDALYEGGNDAVVVQTGVQTRRVSGPEETARVIDELFLHRMSG